MGLFTLTMLLVFHSLIRNGFGCATNAEDCSEIKVQNQSAASGVYEIKLAKGPCNGVPGRYKNGTCCVKVYCDMDRYGGGWTVFQRRYDGSLNFKQNWTKYESGFGSAAGEFYAANYRRSSEYFLGYDETQFESINCSPNAQGDRDRNGNKLLNMLTSRLKYRYELLVELDQYQEKCRLFARYSDFQIGSASTNYRLSFGSYLNGTAGHGLHHLNFVPFSTYDKDNDNYTGNCAEKHKGAWWYVSCHSTNLNGEYAPTCKERNCTAGCVEEGATTMIWSPARGYFYSFKGTEMKLRPAGYKLHTPQLNHWLCLEDYEFLPCPGDCHWNQWGEWSNCSVPSPGTRTRSGQEKHNATKGYVRCRGPKSQAVKCVPGTTVLQTSACNGSTPRDCSDIKLENKTAKSGVYLIKLTDSPCNRTMQNAKTQDGKCCVAVYCDMTRFGGGWTVFQKRFNGQQDFSRNWTEYETGFGSLTNEFYAGNQFLYRFTQREKYEMLVELYMNDEKCSLHAHYASFSITNPKKYSGKVGRYLNGTAGDALLESHHEIPFSTYDRDNDNVSSRSCAEKYKGGWWYGGCLWANLNGEYRAGCHRLHDPNENENSTLCPSNFEIYPCPNDCHWALWTSWSECESPLGEKAENQKPVVVAKFEGETDSFLLCGHHCWLKGCKALAYNKQSKKCYIYANKNVGQMSFDGGTEIFVKQE